MSQSLVFKFYFTYAGHWITRIHKQIHIHWYLDSDLDSSCNHMRKSQNDCIELKPVTFCLCKNTAMSLTWPLRFFHILGVCCKTSIRPPENVSTVFGHCIQYVYRTVQLVVFAWWNFTLYKYIIKTKCTKGCSKKDIFYCGIFRSYWWNDCFLSLFPSSVLYNVTEERSPRPGRRPVYVFLSEFTSFQC